MAARSLSAIQSFQVKPFLKKCALANEVYHARHHAQIQLDSTLEELHGKPAIEMEDIDDLKDKVGTLMDAEKKCHAFRQTHSERNFKLQLDVNHLEAELKQLKLDKAQTIIDNTHRIQELREAVVALKKQVSTLSAHKAHKAKRSAYLDEKVHSKLKRREP